MTTLATISAIVTTGVLRVPMLSFRGNTAASKATAAPFRDRLPRAPVSDVAAAELSRAGGPRLRQESARLVAGAAAYPLAVVHPQITSVERSRSGKRPF